MFDLGLVLVLFGVVFICFFKIKASISNYQTKREQIRLVIVLWKLDFLQRKFRTLSSINDILCQEYLHAEEELYKTQIKELVTQFEILKPKFFIFFENINDFKDVKDDDLERFRLEIAFVGRKFFQFCPELFFISDENLPLFLTINQKGERKCH